MLKNILEYFEKTVSLFPEKRAVADKTESYTFIQLKNAAACIADAINSCGRDVRCVAVFADRAALTIAMFLGVLYSGKHYIPLDPSMPSEKMKKILADSDIEIIIGNSQGREKAEGLSFDGDYISADTLSAENTDYAIPDTDMSDTLYTVYTSGSTGTPKGVVKSHRAMASFIDAYTKTFGFDENEVIGNQTPFFFDASAKDIYLMIKTGATMEILPTEMFSFPVTLIDYMNERKVTFVSWVPSALTIVTTFNTFKEIKPEFLRKVFFVGEAFPAKHLRKWMEALPDIEYVNLYGSSETAGICCYSVITQPPAEDGTLPIGKPLSNCKVFLCDDGEYITEKGRHGEIIVCGDALADEYKNDPEKTANSFFVTKLPDGTQARVFRTGDIAQYDENGELCFVSRKDSQIKHMGHRIELGEIEAAAMGVAGIHRCCCIYNEAKMKIILVCELSDGTEMTGIEIRRELRNILSDYMVPQKVMLMDKLPLNANGKTDRKLIEQIVFKEK